jgi:type I restriction enzyme M protein
MINKDNFKDLLKHLGFTQVEIQDKMFTNVFSKEFPDINAYLKADLDNGVLIFPEDKGLIINTRTTCNFSQNENFVVFECIHNLFKQGYKPEHIELEPKWKLGHESKSGRADILIKDFTGKPLLIIECKTAGDEFDKEWSNMLNDGGQLFSYLKEERNTKFICLYASDFSDNELTFQHYIITTTDIQNLVEKFDKKPNKPLFYKDAANAKELYKAWKDTYKLEYSQQGIFGEEFQAYNIGSKKITVNNLDKITKKHIQGKYNEFATILRQHNVSGRENAFDKLVNLFLCKIVDETTNPNDLKFYWKGEYFDNYFDLLDRLQKLYSDGMKIFLEDEVTYIDFQTIKDTFKFYSNDKDATQEKIIEHFKKQKYFTNNDFSFIDVHNEKLFFQNADILLKVIKMWQDFLVNGDQQNQFLGDMFECFLDKGVKQSEGQFFTPMPICKFIISSLPLENLIVKNQNPPMVIDYACGAGHFLTELAAQIKPHVDKHKKISIKEYYKNIFGIEKEYRLSKVAKVSAFMYSQKEINITYADALAYNEKFIDNNFSVLVANPPYSVKGFLKTLSDDDINRYKLTKTIDEKSFDRNNTIETFFIERAKQLLKPDGVAGIILPTSILSRGSKKSTSDKENTYVHTREILLQYFDIIAIAEFGSGTFGKTGTTTAILFLRKRDDNPEPSEHYKTRVDSWFKNDKSRDDIYEDDNLLKKYCEHVEIAFDDYKTLLEYNPSESLLNYEVFKEYVKDFENSKDTKDLKSSYAKQILNLEKTITSEFNKDNKATKTKISESDFDKKVKEEVGKRTKELEVELENELRKNLIEFIQAIEKDKLLYFILANSNKQNVLIIKSPSENREKKNFLGYEWSSKKGKEGIKYIGASTKAVKSEDDEDDEDTEEKDDIRILSNLDALSNIKTPLYDNDNPLNEEKINYYVQQNFLGNSFDVPENLQPFVSYVRLIDMLDFKSKNFDKVIFLNPKENIEKEIETKWELKKLEDIAQDIFAGGDRPTEFSEIKTDKYKIPIFSNSSENLGLFGYTNVARVKVPSVTVSARGTIGYTVYREEPFFPIVRLIVIIPNDKLINGKYLELVLAGYNFFNSGANIPQLTVPKISNVKIPLPPLDIQKIIVDECKDIDKSLLLAQENDRKLKSKLETEINTWFQKFRLTELSEIIKLQNGKGLTKREFILDGKYLVYGGNGVTGKYNQNLSVLCNKGSKPKSICK